MSTAEFVRWFVYYARMRQREELAALTAKHGR